MAITQAVETTVGREVTWRNAAKVVTELADAGRVTEAIEIAGKWDSGLEALERAGWTSDGTRARPECPCRFYRAAPRAHDRFLDLPDLRPEIQWFMLLNSVCLGGADRIGRDEHPLFVDPEDISEFFKKHRLSDDTRLLLLSGRMSHVANRGLPERVFQEWGAVA